MVVGLRGVRWGVSGTELELQRQRMGQTQGVISLTFVFLISATNCRLHWTLNCNCECEQLLDWY